MRFSIAQAWPFLLTSTLFNHAGLLPRADRGVDLRIALTPYASRSAISLERVRVQNLGDVEGRGTLYFEVASESGQILLRKNITPAEAFIAIPAFDLGGKEGVEVPLQSVSHLQELIDSLARANARYHLRAVIETDGADTDPTNNLGVVGSDQITTVFPDSVSHHQLVFRNQLPATRTVRWHLDLSKTPYGWSIVGLPDTTLQIQWNLNTAVEVNISVRLPRLVAVGESWGGRISLIDSRTKQVLVQKEVFAVFDTTRPTLADARVILLQDSTVAVQVRGEDGESGISCANTRVSIANDIAGPWESGQRFCHAPENDRTSVIEYLLPRVRNASEFFLSIRIPDFGGNTAELFLDGVRAFLAPPGAEAFLKAGSPVDPFGGKLVFSLNSKALDSLAGVWLPLTTLPVKPVHTSRDEITLKVTGSR